MNKIILATRNKDKFRIISKLLSTNNFKDYDFYCLNDIEDIIVDKKESGSILNRAYEKAMNAFNSIHDNCFDYIIGIDDGIKMKGKMIENIKEYIDLIIKDKYLTENEEITIVRAYSFINKKGNCKSIVTEIPFKYMKLDDDIIIEENTYPLSYVMAPLDKDFPVSKLSSDESNDYYLKYSKEMLDEVEQYFND